MPLDVAQATGKAVSATSPDGSSTFPINVRASIGSATIATAQISVTTAATLLAAARSNRSHITVVNHGATDVFIGDSGVTTTTGVLLVSGAGSSITVPYTGALYGRVAAGSQTVSILETF